MKPQVVQEWEDSVMAIEAMAPKCCYTCFEYIGGSCAEFGQAPPKEFKETVDCCPKWNRSAF